MDLWQSLNGIVTVELTSADTAADLRAIQSAGIVLYHIERLDDLSLRFQLRRQDIRPLRRKLRSRGADLKVIRNSGIYWTLKGMVKRPVLIAGILLILLMTLFLPTRIYFFHVNGNVTVPDRLILEQAAQCGLEFGAMRRDIRSEKIKNALLAAIPELQWAGINTSGCVATISVRERQKGEKAEENNGVSSIVAVRDGVIQQCTVTKGSGSCKVGQAVKAGQVLISGYTDCGFTLRAERAEGEVYALTQRDLTLIFPLDWCLRGEKTAESKKISLQIGKKRINFYQGSGILDTECVKMYETKYVVLPGGFQLPFGIIIETWISYDHQTDTATGEDSASTLSGLADNYLRHQMVAGQILNRQETLSQEDGILRLTGMYGCHEMIGQEKSEEIITP